MNGPLTRPTQPEPMLPWPIPGDTQLDQARTIARDLWRHLERIDPRMAQKLAARYQRFSVTWLTSRLDTYDEAVWLTTEDVAKLGSVSARAVRMWTARGIRRDGETVRLKCHLEGYTLREVQDFLGRRNGAGADDTPSSSGLS